MLFSTLNGHMCTQFWFAETGPEPFLPATHCASPAAGAALSGTFAGTVGLPMTFARSCAVELSVLSGAQRPEQTTVVEPVISVKNGTKPGAQPLMYAVFGPGVAAGRRSVRIAVSSSMQVSPVGQR